MSKFISESCFKDTKEIKACSVPEGFDAFLLSFLYNKNDENILHIARNDKRANLLKSAIGFFCPSIETIYFPAWDCLPFDRSGPRLTIQAERLSALSSLISSNSEKKIILTTVNAITQRVPPKEHLQDLNFNLEIGKYADLLELRNFLHRSGYLETAKVLEVGDYSIRGGIIDIFPPLASYPIRCDFFGDLLENARLFSIEDQRSVKQLTGTIFLTPVREVCLEEEHIVSFRKKYLKNFGVPTKSDHLYHSISAGQIFPGYEHWIPYFYNEMSTLLDFISNPIISFDSNSDLLFQERMQQISEYHERRTTESKKQTKFNSIFNPVDTGELYLDEQEWGVLVANHRKIHFSQFKEEGAQTDLDFGGRIGKNFSVERQTEGKDLFLSATNYLVSEKKKGNLVAIVAYSVGSLERLKKLIYDQNLTELEEFDSCSWDSINHKYNFVNKNQISSKRVGIGILPIENGFVVPGLTLISEQDILGKRLFRQNKYSRKVKNPLQDFSEISLGDLVVHIDHGVGKYMGFKTIMAAGAPHDCLIIQYVGEDKLFLPVENLNLLSKYGQESGELDKLGSFGWQNRRANTKKRINEMAKSLIEIAAKRQMNKGVIHEPDPILWDKFCSGFQFEETDDQDAAIGDVLRDISSGHPMDRLICGDVGFGKTEVALRAALVVALDGFQVAILTPTTLLARQHYLTFVDRFKDTPINIEKLTRFESPKDRANVLSKLSSGQVDIVIGTHALLSKNVKFNNLGLLVVDEEQHFGVAHKEVLKSFRTNVHVLTLTATPIPRTLQLALTGVRDLSLISTPPLDRLVVRTFVMEFDSIIIREALLREKNRGGQSFFVVPRVFDISIISRFLEEEMPEISFEIAHGKIPGAQLDKVLNGFLSKKIDLLLSTSIVESGLDFPNSNTLIVYRADMFGLSQLYQIRGRVGRSKARAYCYLTYEHGKALTPQGEKRLTILASINSLGEGFSLASQDLDIRGAGNLLGEEQSGDIREVGYELYQTMLSNAIDKLKSDGRNPDHEKESWSPQIDLSVPVVIPENYITDLDTRLALYRELSHLRTDTELDEFVERLLDRFGPVPSEINTLIDVMSIKNHCVLAGVAVLKAGVAGLSLGFHENKFSDPDGLMNFIQSNKSKIKVKDSNVVISMSWENDLIKMSTIKKIVMKLADMSNKKKPS